MIDGCIAFFKKEQEEEAFRDYIAQAGMSACNNLAGAFGGTSITMTFYEMLHPKVEERTAREIKDEIKNKLNAAVERG